MADNNVRSPAVKDLGVLLPTQTISATHAGDIRSISTLKTKLLTQGYTAAQLQLMTENDMLYAYRIKNGLEYK